MKIFTADQLREWDRYTIKHEPVSSIDLMERAAWACTTRILEISTSDTPFIIFAGPGNNGGDGFAIARQLALAGRQVSVYQLYREDLSPDCHINRDRWTAMGQAVNALDPISQFPDLPPDSMIIDAIFGTGQNRPMEGIAAETCRKINAGAANVVSIDIPSGMYADRTSVGNPVLRANLTLTFQTEKLCFLVAENANAFGQVEVLDIGLHPAFEQQTEARLQMTTGEDIRHMLKPRPPFAHKGYFGNALILAGSYGMAGAALLAAKACLRSGTGKVYAGIPMLLVDILQAALPEAIVLAGSHDRYLTTLPDNLSGFDAIAIGPGIGMANETKAMIHELLDTTEHPAIVWDADALNIVAAEKLINKLPTGSVLTPHVGEFNRLFGKTGDDFARLEACLRIASERRICIILKGKFTLVATPEGRGYFNSTGNTGLAKGGSGDLLTGVITAFLAQKYPVSEACRLGVYLHGLAADLAAADFSETAVLPSDVVDYLGQAFLRFQ